jgi:precorrin-6A/cobalt-precorrin-6A reductase
MILVFGGTTEGKKVAKFLEREALPYFYSTKTEIEFDKGQFGSYRFGAFSSAELIAFCQENKIDTIIHASHPFAEILHQTIAEACTLLSLPVIRFERQYPVKSVSKDVIYVKNYDEAIAYLNTKKIEKLLALTGVQTIEKLESYWKKNNTYFRILPRESSLAIAEKAGFPKENLILEFPSDDLNYEIEILKKHNCQAVITKESGESGFLSTKIEAAKICKIPIVIIERVMLPKSFLLALNETDLFNFMTLKK